MPVGCVLWDGVHVCLWDDVPDVVPVGSMQVNRTCVSHVVYHNTCSAVQQILACRSSLLS